MSIGGFLKSVLHALAQDLAPREETHATNDDGYFEPTDSYDPYTEAMSDDNPFLGVESTGFVYRTLDSAMMAHWPHVLLAPSLAADSLENAVLGALEAFTDNDEASAKGMLFEAGRLVASILDIAPEQALKLRVLGVYDTVEHELVNDAFVSDGCLYLIEAFVKDEFEEVFEGYAGLPGMVQGLAGYLVDKHGLDSLIDGYRILTVTILMIGIRQWISDEFPEFEGVEEDAASD